MRLILSAATAALIIGGCANEENATQDAAQEEPTTQAADTVENEAASEGAKTLDKFANTITEEAATAPEATGEERFFGKKAFTIKSVQDGLESGEVTEHVRDWGRTRAEVKTTSISMGGFTQETSQKVIYNGAEIVTVDLATGSTTKATNPLYSAIVARMHGKSGVEFGKEMMTQMGGVETGERGNFAGHDCTYWELASMGTKTCVTPWGGTLHTLTNMGGVTMEKTAVEVSIGDGGPDDAFDYDASAATAAPSMNDIMKKAREAAGQQQ